MKLVFYNAKTNELVLFDNGFAESGTNSRWMAMTALRWCGFVKIGEL